jgi:cell division protein FtsI (penicillin-binding protein 3)
LRLGKQRLHEAIRNFGFGSKSGIDLPGETMGLVRDWQNWSGLSIGAISFGQEVGVTSIQMIAAINAIANGGFLVRPSIVDRVIDEKGNLINARIPERVRLMSPRTAGVISDAFEGVAIRGTGRQAALEGYRAAGKTGTAQKIIDGRYSDTKFTASFIGYAPLPTPRLTILVQIDEPVGKHYGGEVCGPVFKKIAQQALMQLHVPPDDSVPFPKLAPMIVEDRSQDRIPDITAPVPLPVSFPVAHQANEGYPRIVSIQIEGESVLLPDFSGLAKRSVLDRCLDLGIQLKSTGSGVAVFQSPSPGERVPIGAKCRVTFAKGNLKKQMAASKAYYAAQRSDSKLSVSIHP